MNKPPLETMKCQDGVDCVDECDPFYCARMGAALTDSFDYRWRDVEVTPPPEGAEVILFHCLGDSRRGMHAYDIASYIKGKWVFPWDRGELNHRPRWPIAWMPIKKHPSDK